ncbi:Ligand binding domain of hormone receptors protein [Tyrophagus putrescentiae]|nr:Ligand binding domain of hormone receptors protein [Tyrophagus putrescentiae]
MNTMNSEEKICRVCGDFAIGYNYNILTCLSCKVFFHRNSNKNECRKQSSCPVDLTNRSCTKCRIEKCFQVGMSRFSSVRGCSTKPNIRLSSSSSTTISSSSPNLSIAQTPQQKRPDRLLELTIHNELTNEDLKHSPTSFIKTELSPPSPPKISTFSSFSSSSSPLKTYELQLIKEITDAMKVFPDERSVVNVVQATTIKAFFDVPEMYFRCFMQFCKKISAFACLKREDQLLIVKPYCFDMLFSRFVFLFDRAKNGYPMVESLTATSATFINMSVFKELKNQERLEEYINFYINFQHEMDNDWTLFGLLSAQLMFAPREAISCPGYMRYNHFRYSSLLMKYLVDKYGTLAGGQEKYQALMSFTALLRRMKENEVMMFSEMDLTQVPHIMIEVYSEK